MSSEKPIPYKGSNFFRQRIVLSTLSGRPVQISGIRENDQEIGIKDYEVTFLKLIDELTNGSTIEINRTGTQVTYFPGLLSGGKINLECGNERCISYFLEPLMQLAPFAKHAVRAHLTGVTNSPLAEPSVDTLKASWLPVMRRFILNDDDLDMKINKRGFLPNGGGDVFFSCPVIRQLRPTQFLKQGKIKKIRGMAFAAKVSPLIATRMIESAKSILKDLLGDVYITADHRKGPSGGNSPGFGLFLSAETTEGVIYTGEAMSQPSSSSTNEADADQGSPAAGNDDPSTPEDVGLQAAGRLLDEIYRGGCMDSSGQSLATLFMVLCHKDVSKILSGPLSQYSLAIYWVHMLRHIRDFLDAQFRVEPVAVECDKVAGEPLALGGQERLLLVCLVVGYSNMNKVLL